MAVLRGNRSQHRAAFPGQGITQHDIEVLEACLEEGDTIGRSLLAEMRAGTTSSLEEVAAAWGVQLDGEPNTR